MLRLVTISHDQKAEQLFYFDVTVNGCSSLDTVGTEFDSLSAARREAVRSLMAIAKDEATEIDHQRFEIVVRVSEGPVYRAAVTFDGGLDHPTS